MFYGILFLKFFLKSYPPKNSEIFYCNCQKLRTDFGAGCVQLLICFTEPPGENCCVCGNNNMS